MSSERERAELIAERLRDLGTEHLVEPALSAAIDDVADQIVDLGIAFEARLRAVRSAGVCT